MALFVTQNHNSTGLTLALNQLIGNKVTESDIRKWLDQNGYIGRNAKFEELELHAISRPGWCQVFRFRLKTRKPTEDPDFDDPVWDELHGVVVDDERKKTQSERTKIQVFDSEQERSSALEHLSEGMITCRRNQNGTLGIMMIVFLGIVLIGYLATLIF